jgi:hypothetical protein
MRFKVDAGYYDGKIAEVAKVAELRLVTSTSEYLRNILLFDNGWLFLSANKLLNLPLMLPLAISNILQEQLDKANPDANPNANVNATVNPNAKATAKAKAVKIRRCNNQSSLDLPSLGEKRSFSMTQIGLNGMVV